MENSAEAERFSEGKNKMEFDEVKQLIDIMNNNDLSEIEVEKDGLKIRLKKNTAGSVTIPAPLVNMSPAPAAKPEAPAQMPEEAPGKSGLVAITSPIVGTFYEAPSPDANPYVEVGSVVEPETVVCIIEAMKVMNEIKAEVDGRIVERLVASGEAVEFGQTLFLVDPEV